MNNSNKIHRIISCNSCDLTLTQERDLHWDVFRVFTETLDSRLKIARFRRKRDEDIHTFSSRDRKRIVGLGTFLAR